MTVPVGSIQYLSPRNFNRLAKFIHSTVGIKMPDNKRVMLEGRLRRRLNALGLPNFDAYCRFLFEEGGLSSERVALIDAVTTNKTEFFREPDHFRFLAERTLPELAAAGIGMGGRAAKIWSTAASIGAEPYTIAMVMAEFSRANTGWRGMVVGTDICTDALQKGVTAIYPEQMIAPVPMDLRRRYLLRSKDRHRAEVRIAPELRRLVTFGRLNLMDGQYGLDRDFDAVFCRNQLIYFDKPTQQAVLERIATHLRPGGHLFLGHSETITGFELPFRPIAASVFIKD
jgi:chemotaxis protein methyltransferase CheR